MVSLFAVLALFLQGGLLGSCAYDDEDSALLQAQIKNHNAEEEDADDVEGEEKEEEEIAKMNRTSCQSKGGWTATKCVEQCESPRTGSCSSKCDLKCSGCVCAPKEDTPAPAPPPSPAGGSGGKGGKGGSGFTKCKGHWQCPDDLPWCNGKGVCKPERCDKPRDCSSGRCNSKNYCAECLVHSDCKDGWCNKNGVCKETKCKKTQDCGSGKCNKKGVCYNTEPTKGCSDWSCKGHWQCCDEVPWCHPQKKVCKRESCKTSKDCTSGRCKDASFCSECLDHSDCPGGWCNANGVCKKTQCAFDIECQGTTNQSTQGTSQQAAGSSSICNSNWECEAVPATAPPARWHLAPGGAWTCDSGHSASQGECAAAGAEMANAHGGSPRRGLQVGNGGNCMDGGWGQVPIGCSVQAGGDWAAHYKGSGKSCSSAHPHYRLVCSGSGPPPTPAPVWHLAPAGSTFCNGGTSASQHQCDAAVRQLATAAYRTPGRGQQNGNGGGCNDGGWGNVPIGCSAQTGGDWAAHYKSSGANCGHAHYQLVCSGDPGPLPEWHLAPGGATACDYGRMATQGECGGATAQLASKAHRSPGRGQQNGNGGRCNDGGWGNVPVGCSAQTGGDWAAHYKGSGANCGHPHYQPVCTGK